MTEADDWNSKIIAEFRANGGKVGGPFEGHRSCCCTPPARGAASRG